MRNIVRSMRILSASAFVLLVSTAAGAVELKAYDQKSFEAAQKAGTPIIVDIWASWCPTCAAQQPIIEKLTSSSDFSDLTIFRVDFDKQKDVVRSFKAQSQSTLIAFKGDSETARSVGDTDAKSIEKLFRSTLKKN